MDEEARYRSQIVRKLDYRCPSCWSHDVRVVCDRCGTRIREAEDELAALQFDLVIARRDLRNAKEQRKAWHDRPVDWRSEETMLSPVSLPPRRIISGVYFVQAENGLIKIGESTNIKRRFAGFKQTFPVDVMLVGYIEETDDGDSRQTTEMRLHNRFCDARMQGEWFAPADELLAFIKEL